MVILSAPKSALETASAVIDAVGGTAAAARLTSSKLPSVSNWRVAGRLPPATFLEFGAALAERGLVAPSMLWGIRPAPSAQR